MTYAKIRQFIAPSPYPCHPQKQRINYIVYLLFQNNERQTRPTLHVQDVKNVCSPNKQSLTSSLAVARFLMSCSCCLQISLSLVSSLLLQSISNCTLAFSNMFPCCTAELKSFFSLNKERVLRFKLLVVLKEKLMQECFKKVSSYCQYIFYKHSPSLISLQYSLDHPQLLGHQKRGNDLKQMSITGYRRG